MMLKLIRNRAGLVLAGLIAALCPMLMAPSGGLPSKPTFQQIYGPQGDRTHTFAAGFQIDNGVNSLWMNNVGTAAALSQGMHWSGSNWVCDIGASAAAGALQIVNGATSALTTTCPSIGSTVSPTSSSLQLTSGSYTATTTGCTTAPTSTVFYTVIGTSTAGLVVLRVNNPVGCTSNATTFTLTGAPAAIRPSTLDASLGAVDGCGFTDNSVAQCGKVSTSMSTTGVLTFFINNTNTGWTASGTKSSQVFTYAYPLQ